MFGNLKKIKSNFNVIPKKEAILLKRFYTIVIKVYGINCAAIVNNLKRG
jgi:hypothetical protein